MSTIDKITVNGTTYDIADNVSGYLTSVDASDVTYDDTQSLLGNTVQLALDTLDYNMNALDSAKQDTLVSGTNIKTINNTSLLGSGNIDIQGGGGGSYTAGTGIDLTSDVITNTAPVWHGDDVGTFTNPINADQLEGYSLLNLLKLIYPVGSVYLNVNNVNPSSFITGTTWELISSVGLASENVFGNEYNLGITEGPGTTAGISYTSGLGATKTAYGMKSPTYAGGSGEGSWTTGGVGVVTKSQTGDHPEYSGIIADTITLYTWKRTA